VQPMDYRNLREFGDNVVQAFKALGLPVPDDTPEPEATPEAGPPAVVAGKATEQTVTKTSQEDTMSEEVKEVTKEAPALDIAAIVAEASKAAADAAVKAYRAELEKEPPVKSGLQVVADEEDKKAAVTTWKMGEFLQAIAREPEKVRAYKSDVEAGGYNLTKAIGAKRVGSVAQAKAKAISGMSELVPADGGFLVGTDQNLTIIDKVYNSSDLLGRVDMTTVSGQSNGMTFVRNAESSRADGSRWGGALYYWACEAAEKTSSKPTFERVSLELNKIIGLVYATDELLQDASALESYLMSIMPQELAFGVQDSLINGTGAGMPLGVLNAPCLVTQAAEAGQAADTVVSENVINMWSRRWVGARDYVWLINQDVGPQLMQMNLGVGTGGQLTYMPPGGLSASPYGSLFGRPVIEIEQCSTVGDVGDILLCSWSEYQMISKGGVQNASSIHVRFIFDETVFRFVYRCDGTPKWSLPITPYKTAATALTQGPFVALAARA